MDDFNHPLAAPGGIGEHLRLCVSVAALPTPYVPSEVRQCGFCGQDVWYDPKASVYPAGEKIICDEPCGKVAIDHLNEIATRRVWPL